MLFARLGMANDRLAAYTSLLYLPWVIKFLWSPSVDTCRTKRWWVLVMETAISVLTIAIALSIRLPYTLILALFLMTAFCSATHDIAADGYYMLALTDRQQAEFVGIRSTFYRLASIFGQGILIVIAGLLEDRLGDIPIAWSLTLAATGALMALLALYHVRYMPRVEATQTEHPRAAEVIRTFIRKPGIGLGIAFLLLYRLSEGLMVKLTMPFLLDLGFSTSTIGFINGTAGVIALLLGGILGGVVIARYGLRRCLWPMALALTIPSLVYIAIAACSITNPWLVGALVSLEQFGYGVGFSAYMLYMIHLSEGPYKTSHYAICTAFMALSMMLPGFVAGAIEVAVGYTWFFVIANACSILTFLVTGMVHKRL